MRIQVFPDKLARRSRHVPTGPDRAQQVPTGRQVPDEGPENWPKIPDEGPVRDSVATASRQRRGKFSCRTVSSRAGREVVPDAKFLVPDAKIQEIN